MSDQSQSERNIEHRAVIKFLVKKGKTATEINKELCEVYGDSAPSFTMVKKWTRLFQQGRESLEDDPRSGRPITAITDENIAKVEKIVLEDRRIKLWQIASILKISKERVGMIIHEHLHMSKVSARWVPRMLTPFDKQRRVATSRNILDVGKENWDEFCNRIVTVDETWIHQYDPESKQESMQWITKGERAPKKFKTQRAVSKLMATIFWDSEGILLIDYLAKGTTMNGIYYANLIGKVRQSIVEKRRGKLSRGVLFLQDNAPSHTALVARRAVKDAGFEELAHPPYSPDLAPSDYFLFRNLKKDLRGRRFSDEEEMKSAVSQHFEGKPKEYFFNGIHLLYNRCETCIRLQGDYIEK